MTMCKSGQHWWDRQEDADKCCNPEYRRNLVVANTWEKLPTDAKNVRVESGAFVCNVWERIEDGAISTF